MTEQQGTTTPTGESLADEPIPDAAAEAPSASAKAREWVAQLDRMIQDMATQAAPVARQIGAKAAELAAVAAVKAGPLAHRAAVVTTDVGQRFAERAQSVAAELRGEVPAAPAEPAPAAETTPEPEAGEPVGTSV